VAGHCKNLNKDIKELIQKGKQSGGRVKYQSTKMIQQTDAFKNHIPHDTLEEVLLRT
jgi:hypothetical protein